MGWARGRHNGREVGYSIRARCDWPDCKTIINRGLAYACGGMHGESENACEGYFCEEHRKGFREGEHGAVCNDCAKPPSRRRRHPLRFMPGVPEKVAAIVDGICELPDHTSPPDKPDLLMCTIDELATILNRHLLGEE